MFGVTSTATAEILRLDLPKKGIQLILLQNLGIAEFDKSFLFLKKMLICIYTLYFPRHFRIFTEVLKYSLGFKF